MARIHFFEIEDQPWLPAILRAYVTDYLGFLGNLNEAPYRDFVRHLRAAIDAVECDQIIELGAGSGGPLPTLLALLDRSGGRPLRAVQTELHPRAPIASAEGRIRYEQRSIDATALPSDLRGFRLLCNAFHHFRPELARAVLSDAIKKGDGIAIFEAVERTPASILICAGSFFTSAVVAPFIRPFSPGRLVLSWVIPIVPFICAFDGIVSSLRVYSPTELRELVESIPGHEGYVWTIERAPLPSLPVGVTFLVGHPKPEAQAKETSSQKA